MVKRDSSKVIEFFKEFSKIPRGSGNEQKISDYLVDFAKKRNLYVEQDKSLNIFIVKEATEGYEEYEPLILQAHMDMVCEKLKDVDFNFETDPINIYEEDGFLKAKGTTLGADDGAGLAIILAILDDNTLKHPKLEVVITADEEVGMTGAYEFDASKLTGQRMINIDTEEDDKIYVSSAGGTRITSVLELKKERVDIADKIFKLEISGLVGGHSGIDINKGLGNANKILIECLKHIMIKYEICIIEINGGDKDNAIPREAEVIFTTPDAEYQFLNEEIKMICQIMNYGLKDEVVNYKLTEQKNTITDNISKIKHTETVKLIKFLTSFPYGVVKMSEDIEGLVQTSLNMGVVRTIKEQDFIKVTVNALIRSSYNPDLEIEKEKIDILTKKFEGYTIKEPSYKAWEYNKESKLRKLFEKSYKEYTNEDSKLGAIHAGLECGIFIEKNENIDIISMGPNIYGAHTPHEKLEIKSIEKVYNIIVLSLENYDIKK